MLTLTFIAVKSRMQHNVRMRMMEFQLSSNLSAFLFLLKLPLRLSSSHSRRFPLSPRPAFSRSNNSPLHGCSDTTLHAHVH